MGALKTATRIVTGKICLAPDYLLVPAESVVPMIKAISRTTAQCYPTLRNNRRSSPRRRGDNAMGGYHGRDGFLEFSHHKSVCR